MFPKNALHILEDPGLIATNRMVPHHGTGETTMQRHRTHRLAFVTNVISVTFAYGISLVLGVPLRAQTVSAHEDDVTEESYHFETANFAGDTFTQLLGINQRGEIAGYHGSGAAGHPNTGFTLKLPDRFTLENVPNAMQTQVMGINSSGETDGFYIDAAGTNHGFIDDKGTFTTVDFPGTPLNQLLGINDHGQAAGYYADAAGIDHPYIFDSSDGVFLVISIPSAVGGAQATGINDRERVSGFYIDSAGVNHGFLLSEGKLIILNFPGSTFTQALGVNNQDQVVGDYLDEAGLMHGFLYCRGHFQSLDDPNGLGTTIINGINDEGAIVGFYVDSQGNTDGFVATTWDRDCDCR
jgi:hypothetical protein